MIRCESHNLAGSCGAGLLYAFDQFGADGDKLQPNWPAWRQAPVNQWNNLAVRTPAGGAGWTCAAFVPTAACKEAYAILASRFKIVLQTPPRRNNNSGRSFVFVVYDTKPARGARPRWVGQRSGAPKPQALIEWEKAKPLPIDNSAHKWPFK